MNTITVNFIPCSPTPPNGYNIQWRVAGSADPYTDAGNFTESPAIFTDDTNPVGTNYEGIIRSDFTESGESGNRYCNDLSWTTVVESGGSGEEGIGGISNMECVDTGRILNVSLDFVTVDISPDTYPLASGESGSSGAIAPGIYTLRVSTDGDAGSIRVVDSNGSVQCLNYAGADIYEFPNFVINAAAWSVVLDCDPC